MAIDWKDATDKQQLEVAAAWVYRLLNMVRPMITPIDGEHGGPVFVQYLCIPATKENDERIREIADEWKASGLFWRLPLFARLEEEADAPLTDSVTESTSCGAVVLTKQEGGGYLFPPGVDRKYIERIKLLMVATPEEQEALSAKWKAEEEE